MTVCAISSLNLEACSLVVYDRTQKSFKVRRWCPVVLYITAGASQPSEIYCVDTSMAINAT